MKKPTQSGFTLVELLLVIAIISLIMSIAIANMQNSRYDAYNAAIRQEVRQLVNQARIEYSQIGRFATVNIPADNGFRTLDTCSDKGITDTSILNTCFSIESNQNENIGLEYAAGDYLYMTWETTDEEFAVRAKLNSNDPNRLHDWYCLDSGGRWYEGDYDGGGSTCP